MEFLKILWDNLKKGPVTDAFPFGETYTPDRLRGRVEIDPALCVGCGTCVHVCAAGAINISKFEDGSGFEITVWRNSCCRHPHQRLAQRPPGHGKIYPDHPRQGQIRLLCRMRGQNARSAAGSAQPHLRQAFRSRRGRNLAPLPELPPHRRGGRGRPRLSYRPARKDGGPRGSLSRSAEKGRKGLGGQGKRKGSSRSGGLCPENSRTLAGSYGTAQVRPCGFQGGAERPDASG